LLGATSKAVLISYKRKEKSSLKQLYTKSPSKKHHDSLYAKSFNDYRIYSGHVENLKTILKYLI
jgi:hypothetical protein